MKKTNLFLMVACATSLIVNPVNAGWQEFQSTLSGYKSCMLRQRKCTLQESKNLGKVVATLIGFAATLSAIFGYKWYEEKMRLSWDGIETLIAQFRAQVIVEFVEGTQPVVQFDMQPLDKYKKVVQTHPLSYSEQNAVRTKIRFTIRDEFEDLKQMIEDSTRLQSDKDRQIAIIDFVFAKLSSILAES